MKVRVHIRSLLSLCLVLGVLFSQTAFAHPIANALQTQQTSKPRPFPPAQYIPSHNFDTIHVALDLTFDWNQEQTIGVETMLFKPLIKDLESVELDAANMAVTKVKLAGNPLKYELDAANQKLRIALGRPYQPFDKLTLTIEYRTNGSQKKIPGLVGAGLRFIKPTPDDPKRPRQIWSQGESEYNHYWFPVYDHPNDFFTSELTATVEKPLSVISNGELLETRDNKDGTRSFHWKIDQPHASYLSSIIVGEFAPIVANYDGIPIVTNVYPSELEEGRITAARLPEMVKFFSEKTGMKYPYAKYAQTTVRDFGGGMENISATTQTDNMIHDARTELDSNTDGLQSHELAHQWFGDYVTCRNWSDIWLNESFATYFQAMWDEHKLGGDDFLYSDVKANQDAYFNAWKQGNRHPIVTRNYVSPDSVFDTYAYPRGGAVLHMLRKSLGEDNWWRAINYYLRKYANQPVETEQFRIAIEEATGQSMDVFFDEWLYRMGHPVFKVTQNYDQAAKALKLTVEQLQTIDATSQFPQVALFETPVEIEIGTSTGNKIEKVKILPKKEQTFTFPVESAPLLVNFDYKGTLIKEIQFEKTTEQLIYQLNRDEDVLGRVWALGQLAARATTAEDSNKHLIAAELSKALAGDKFWGMRAEAAVALGKIKDNSVRDALIAATKDPDARVRARAVTSLATSNDSSLADLYVQLLNDRSYAVIKAAAAALGATKSPQAYPALTKLLETPSWRDNIKASALSGLGALQDKKAIDLALRYAERGNAPQVRTAAIAILGKVGTGDARAFQLLSDTVTRAFESGNSSLGIAAAEALASLGDPKGLPLLDQIRQTASAGSQIRKQLTDIQERLRKATTGVADTPPQQP